MSDLRAQGVVPGVHPTAIVPPEATVGTGVSVGPYAVIEAGAVICDGCVIGPHVSIGPNVRLAERVRVFPNASIGLMAQVRPMPDEPGSVVVGPDTVIRECVTVNAGTVHPLRTDISPVEYPLTGAPDDDKERSPAPPGGDGTTRVGARCLLMAYAHVGHDAVLEDDVTLVNGATLGGFVRVERHATISAMVPVHQYVQIGAYSYIGGGFRVVQDVPPYVLAGGEPLRTFGLNVVGLRRQGFSDTQMRRLRAIYHHFFRSGLNTTQALNRIGDLEPSDERDHFVAFVTGSGRGIVR